MEVVFLTSAFPAGVHDGVDRVHARRAAALARHAGVVVVVPTPWAPPALAGPGKRWARYAATPVRLELDGVPVLYPRYLQTPRMGPWAGVSMALALGPLVDRLRQEGRCDVLFAQAVMPDGLAAVLLARRLGVHAACLGRGTDVHGLATASAATRALARFTLRRLSAVGVVAHALADPLARMQPRRGVPPVLANGIDLERFRPGDAGAARRAVGLPEGGQVVLYVGRLARGKGLDTLVDAFAMIAARQPDTTLVLVGGGEQREALARRAARRGIETLVHFAGAVSWDAVPDWMRAADVLALASEGEGMPNTVREALACGRPVVTTPVGDLPRLVVPSVGLLVPPRDPGALAHALVTALHTRWDPAALRARVTGMTWEQSARATARFLSDAAGIA
jgi:teichuronic acid biosynthesis glycosyltransferase TuaC